MFLPLASIPEDYLYRLLPQGVVDLDQRHLIEAVLGGYQDRVSDLRSYVSALGELVKPDAALPQLGFNVVMVRFTGPAGQVINRALDILPSTPNLDDTDALQAWALHELQLEPVQLLSVSAGTDVLRRVDVDSLSLLADNVGALLYDGLGDETPTEARRTRQKLLESWFPRLKLKGTAESYELLGRLLGFAEVAVTPLWSRLVPHNPSDPGSAQNDGDFKSRPEQTPAARLPDPRYDPLDFKDGEYFDWDSGALSQDGSAANYWPLAINNRNPFVKVTVVGALAKPTPGRYVLDGGAHNRKASVLLNSGTTTSGLRLDAIADGDTFNGLRVNVVDHGTAVSVAISDQLSAVKYRASYFDFKATIRPQGTEPAQPSPDLERHPTLTTDGLAVSPFRPWVGGSVASTVTRYPNASAVVGTVVRARVQADGTTPQYDPVQFEVAARAAEDLDTLRAATRRIRSKGIGVALDDGVGLAAYVAESTIFTTAVGSVIGQGTVEGVAADGPSLPYRVSLQAFAGSVPRDTFMDAMANGTVGVAGDGFLGIYSLADHYYRLLVSAGTFGANGTIKAFYEAQPGVSVRTEPTDATKLTALLGYGRAPEDELGFDQVKLSLHDEDPWSRRPVFAGESVDTDLYLPASPDLALTPATPPYRALALSGHQYELAVQDGVTTVKPYRFKVLALPESDAITGAALVGTYERLLLALDAADALHHVLLIDKLLVSTQYWCRAKWEDLTQWIPFNEHPLDALTPYSRNTSDVQLELAHGNRRWDADRGWTLRLDNRQGVSFTSRVALGDTYTLAVWVKPDSHASSSGVESVVVGLGGVLELTLPPNNPPRLFVKGVVFGSLVQLGTIFLTADAWNMVVVRCAADMTEVAVGLTASSLDWQTFLTPLDPAIDQSLGVSAATRSVSLHDLSLWRRSKTNAELELIRVPRLTPTPVAYPTPYAESLSRDNRYVFRLTSAGFAYPDVEEVTEKPYKPGYAQRYDFTGRYRADDRFKQVGLGDGDLKQVTYPLGLRGIEVEGFGRTLISGSNPPYPGGATAIFGTNPPNAAFVVSPYTTDGGTNQVRAMASSPWPNLVVTNPAVDRVYIKGDDGLMYKVTLDDLGAGAALKAERVFLVREEGSRTPQFREQPTDAQTILGSPGKRLSVQVSGTTFTPYEAADAAQTLTTPPLYLYRPSVVKVAVSGQTTFNRWANRNDLGLTQGVPVLAANGALNFANPEVLPSGNYELTFDVGNLGTLDADFAGYSVTVSLIGSGGSVLASTSGLLLPDGTGTNPRGKSKLALTLTSTVSASSVLSVEWNNDRDVPRKGQSRQLVLYGYEFRLVAPALFRVSANPLVLAAVDISDTTTVRPGGLYGEINSFGTVTALRHEAAVYPDESTYPLSNLLTTSTWRRRETLRVLNPLVAVDPVTPSVPQILAVTPSPDQLYNVGDEVTLNATVQGAGSVTSYVWRFWDQVVATTTTPTIQKVVAPGIGANFTGSVSLTSFDAAGNSSSASTVVQVNKPPVLTISSDRSVGIFPYTAQLNGTFTDPEGATPTLRWYADGVQFASGSVPTFTATKPTIVTAAVDDGVGGLTERRLTFDGSPHLKPVASPIIRPDYGRISNINEVSFAVYALDPNRGGNLTFAWKTWHGTSSGVTTEVANSNAKFNQVTVPLVGQTPGTKLVSVTVSDSENYSFIVQTNIELLQNVAPVITSVTTPSPGALAGSLVNFTAVAVDQDGDPPGYTWHFTSPRVVTLYGGNIQFQTLSGDAGGTIQGTLIVDDSNGSQVTAQIPPVAVANQSVRPLIASSVPGFYQTGFNEALTSPDDAVTIRYSLDGTDIFKLTDGLAYDGSFALFPPAGGIGNVILKARAFKDGFAPSPQFVGEYTFYDPNAAAASTPDVGSSAVTLTTVKASADSVIGVNPNIPGDDQSTSTNPNLQIAGMSATALATEPQLPFTPIPLGSTQGVRLTPEKQFVTLAATI